MPERIVAGMIYSLNQTESIENYPYDLRILTPPGNFEMLSSPNELDLCGFFF